MHTFEPEKSEHIRHLSYDPDTERLHVRFHERKEQNDRTYIYEKVPLHVYEAMTRHPSVGGYFHRVIKRHYKLV